MSDGIPARRAEGAGTERPNLARMHDYLLGGTHNRPVDRTAIKQIRRAYPWIGQTARMERAFLDRAIKLIAGAGIRQFVDIGSGLPTCGNVHEAAQTAFPSSRVVYVDLDSEVVASGRAILARNDAAEMIQGDARDPERIFGHPRTQRLVLLDQPVAVSLVSVLQFVPNLDDPAAIIRRIRDALVPGSFVVISHPTPSLEATAGMAGITAILAGDAQRTATLRTDQQLAAILQGWDLLIPGIVDVDQWHHVGSAKDGSTLPLAAVGVRPPRDVRGETGVARL